MNGIEVQIAEAIVNHAKPGMRIDETTPLFDGGLALDSMQFLEMILDIEKITGAKLIDESLDDEAVRTVGSLRAYVLERLAK